MRHPPPNDRNLEGWLYRVALRTTRRGLFRTSRETSLMERSSVDPTIAVLRGGTIPLGSTRL